MSAAPAKKSSRLIDYLLIVAVAILLTQAVTRLFFPPKTVIDASKPVVVQMQDPTVRYGDDPVVLAQNHASGALSIAASCPRPPFDVFVVQSSGSGEKLIP